MYNALVDAFAIPGKLNTSSLADMITQSQKKFKASPCSYTRDFHLIVLQDTGVLGNFLENQDLPRWHNMSVDVQSLWNAMVFNFMSDG